MHCLSLIFKRALLVCFALGLALMALGMILIAPVLAQQDMVNSATASVQYTHAVAPGNPNATSESPITTKSAFTSTFFTDNFDDNSLGTAWTTYGGVWSESGGVLAQTSTAYQDPKKAIISNSGISFPNDLVIVAKVRVDSWTDGDHARAGVGLFANTSNGQGNNLVFHNDHSTVQFLDDWVAWGPSYTFNWSNGTWYWFKLKMENGTLSGKVWPDGTAEIDTWPYVWTRSGRSGYPALNGGGILPTGTGSSTASFDNVLVMNTLAPSHSCSLGVLDDLHTYHQRCS